MSKIEGRFEKGNEIGKETRFTPGHTLSKKYTPEHADSLLEYFLNCEEFPTLEAWAVQNSIDVRSVYNWVKDEQKYPHFSSTYAQAKAIQKNKLLQEGLAERYNPKLVTFLLTNNHGMSEKTTSDASVTFKVEMSAEIDEESN